MNKRRCPTLLPRRHPRRSLANFADSGLLFLHGDPLIPYPVLVFAAVVVLATYLLHFTVFGRYIYAIGGNRPHLVWRATQWSPAAKRGIVLP